MHAIEDNLSLLSIMLQEMEAYLLSEEVFWPLARRGQKGHLPRLTLSAVLLTLDELEAQAPEMTTPQSSQYQKSKQQFEIIQQKWAAAIERKARSEFQIRLNLWKAYLQDLEQKPQMIEDYSREIRNSVILGRLQRCVRDKTDLAEKRETIRHGEWILQELTRSGEFLWDKRLMPIYPADEYPLLYRQPQGYR